MEGLGEYLKQGRREAGLSLEDLAGRTRIRLENLARLEDGDLASLPTDTYVRGFVRLVCKELGLPADEGIERYEMLCASRAPTDEMVWSAQTDETETSRLERVLRDPERVVGVARWAGIGLAAVLALVLLTVGGRFVAGMFADRGDREVAGLDAAGEAGGAVEAALPPAEDAADADPDAAEARGQAEEPAPAEESPVPAKPAESEAPPAVEAQPEPEPMRLALADVQVPPGRPGIQPGDATPDPAGETDLEAAGEDALEPETPSAPPVTDQDPATVPAATPKPAEAEPAPEIASSQTSTVADPEPAADSPAVPEREPARREIIATGTPGARLELEVEALRAVEFSVLLDGVGRARTRSMQAGDRRTWKADDLFVITVNDGGAVRLRIAGEDLGLAGADGEPVRGLRVRAP